MKPAHVLTGRDQLHSLIKKQLDGIVVEEVKDANPSILEDLQVTAFVFVSNDTASCLLYFELFESV
jgi:hypothetical protein